MCEELRGKHRISGFGQRVRPAEAPEEPRYGQLAGPRSFRIYTPSLLLFSSVMSVSLITVRLTPSLCTLVRLTCREPHS